VAAQKPRLWLQLKWPLRGKSTEEFDVERLRAVMATLDWLMANEPDIRAFLRLPPDGRKAALEMAAHPGPEAS
jgi:sugar/nucleoside kinase (ribokinase family)